MNEKIKDAVSITALCSDLSELICEAKIIPEKELEALNLISAIKKAETAAIEAVRKSEIRPLRKNIEDLEGSIEHLRNTISDLEEKDIDLPEEMQGINTIYYRTDNLADENLMEHIGELIERHGTVRLHQALQTFKL
ncbi:MAG TPA: hypothetical protein VGE79_14425 [Niastella sp.]